MLPTDESALAAPVVAPDVRLLRYPTPAVVLGPSQRRDPAMEARARAAGAELVERAAGGGAVLAGPWLLGVTIALPPGHRRASGSIPSSYGWLGAAFVSWLAEVGIAGRAATAPICAAPSVGWSCFAGLSHGEVEVGGRKIVGLAQARRRNGIVFSAGVLLSPPPWALLCDIMGKPAALAAELARATTSIREEIGGDVGREPDRK